MIDPKELRIGNCIQDEEARIGHVSVICQNTILVYHEEGHTDAEPKIFTLSH